MEQQVGNLTRKQGLVRIEVPKLDWVLIYYTKITTVQYRCNVCQNVIEVEDEKTKLTPMIEHIHTHHKEIYDLHKDNPDDTVGFRIEFLHLNMLNEDESKSPAVTMQVTQEEEVEQKEIMQPSNEENVEYVLITESEDLLVPVPNKSKVLRSIGKQQAKRSWVWKYFENISGVIFRCNLCNVVLSIKGNNTNNMNRHVKSKHPVIYKTELMSATYTRRRDTQEQVTDVGCEVEIPVVKGDQISSTSTPKPKGGQPVKPQALRRSWIWTYFTRLSTTIAQCKLCNRKINHSGYATGNIHRHLKFLHKDVYINSVTEVEKVTSEADVNWIWKLMSTEDNSYCCKICRFNSLKTPNMEKNVQLILQHLRNEHGVISGDQIISGADCETTDMVECNVAVDFLKGTEM